MRSTFVNQQMSVKRLVFATPAMRTYYPDNVIMKRDVGEYYCDPMDVAERTVRMFALHDACRDPTAVTLECSFEALGLNALDMVEVFLGLEREFDMEFDEEDCELLRTVNDVVEFLAKSSATKA